LGKWKYWLLLAIVMAFEFARQQGTDSFWTASAQDIALILVLALNWRRWSVATYLAILAATTFAVLHSALLDIPVQIGAFGVRSLIYLVATIDIIASAERELIASKKAVVVLAVFVAGCALYAVFQQVTGFRYNIENDILNAAIVSDADSSLVRIPSVFYNFSTYAKFCVSVLIALLVILSRPGTSSGIGAGVVIASVFVGIVLSAQRAGLAVSCVILLWFLVRSGGGGQRLALVLGAAGVVYGAITFPGYFERAESAASFERVQTQLIEGLPRAFEEVPLWTGRGLGRMTSAAFRYDREFNTNIAMPWEAYEGGEGVLHSALGQGGVPWLIVTLLAMGWGLRRNAGHGVHYFTLAFSLWGITHDVWGSPQPYLMTLLPMLAACNMGAAMKTATAPQAAAWRSPGGSGVAVAPAYRRLQS
jgi:hypothetical protein